MGIGVRPDYVLTYTLWNISAPLRDANVKNEISFLKKMSTGEIEEGQALSKLLYGKINKLN